MVATSKSLVEPAQPPEVLSRLMSVCELRGLDGLAVELAEMGAFIGEDLSTIEADFRSTPRRSDCVGRAAGHLLDLEGKRLRPLCVALASRVGRGFGRAAQDLAVSVELVHSATLLHDDVVDLGDTRRGRPAARKIYGNAASVFAGDWLLIEALRRVRGSGVESALESLLEVIDEMIVAEALQLENRGRFDVDRETYFRVIEGKTASLFRWALYAGAKAGELDETAARTLGRFGVQLGLAFQLVDDALDLAGEVEETGKSLLTDVREGKVTYPVIVARERDPGIGALLEAAATAPEGERLPADLQTELIDRLRRAGGVEECVQLAQTYAEQARAALGEVPAGTARTALEVVTEVAVHRVG